MFIQEELDRYFYWINERESIRYVKEQTDETPPYSKDPIFNNYKFCQVFREDDRTTRWFRRHIREPLKDDPDVFMATVIFRWFNLIDTGRTLIENDLLYLGPAVLLHFLINMFWGDETKPSKDGDS